MARVAPSSPWKPRKSRRRLPRAASTPRNAVRAAGGGRGDGLVAGLLRLVERLLRRGELGLGNGQDLPG
eukprot:10774472-Lingulodinium_polyedra.AAC.1